MDLIKLLTPTDIVFLCVGNLQIISKVSAG